MAPQHKQKHVTRNQRRQQRANHGDEDNAEKSVNITDIIGNFRAACLNRARDVRNFADSRDSFVIDEDEQKQLRELTDMLTEQLEFLQDAWDTMMRLVEKYRARYYCFVVLRPRSVPAINAPSLCYSRFSAEF